MNWSIWDWMSFLGDGALIVIAAVAVMWFVKGKDHE